MSDIFDSGIDTVAAALGDDDIISEARKRFDRVNEYESIARQRYIADLLFEQGDSENNYQWPNEIKNARDGQRRPCLTMNIVQQHNKIISNTMKKNKQSVKFVALGNGATKESADVYQDIMRHIEHQSQAQIAYDIARGFMVGPGKGWWRLATDYVGPDSWDQEIFIHPVNDPLSVFMDPNIQQRNGSDSKWAFVFDDVPEDDLYEAYPEYRDQMVGMPLGLGTVNSDWVSKGLVRVCEYFRKIKKPDKAISFTRMGERYNLRRSQFHKLVLDKDSRKKIVDHPQTRIRDVVDEVVEWRLIVGSQVVDETIWPGKYIPLIRCVGEEMTLDGRYDCKGHTRWMKDAQRMFNFNASGQVEFVALQTKVPWMAPVKAIEEYIESWKTANVKNPALLVYNHQDPDNPDVPIPPPQRIDPPNFSPAYQTGMETAKAQLESVSGQHENSMGQQGNERTGAAISARQNQGDTATFHFQDHYEEALIFTGMQIIDLVPKIYDTKRVMQILANDGTDYALEIDPTLKQAYLQEIGHQNEVVKRVFNPLLGQYDIASTVGPAYGSRRDQARDALTLILTQAPGLTGLIGDLLMKDMDFESASEAALRLRRMVPPQALGTGPTQGEQALQQQLTAMQSAMVKLLDEKAKDRLKLVGKEQLRDIESYDAVTKRIAAEAKLLPADPEGLRAMIEQLVKETLKSSIDEVAADQSSSYLAATGNPPAEPSPVPGAQKAPDDEWYIADPTRKGKYLHIAPLAQEHQRSSIIGNGLG
jgi:hypothetical protein